MEKIRLNLDDLNVESFETTVGPSKQGTVFGHVVTLPYTCNQHTCETEDTCPQDTCNTCAIDPSCDGWHTCINACNTNECTWPVHCGPQVTDDPLCDTEA